MTSNKQFSFNRLVAFGDSFVWGLIKELKKPNVKSTRRAESFTKLLAKKLGVMYTDRSWRGWGNSEIYNAVIKLGVKETDLVIVSWSGINRDIYKNIGTSDKKVFRKSLWLDAIVNTTEYLDNVGCEYYYLSSFQDYRLTAPTRLPKYCTKNWLWYDQPYSTLHDFCVNSKKSYFNDLGMYEHGTGTVNIVSTKDEYDYLVEKFAKESPYLSQCHHPSELGHQMLADLIYNKLFS